MFDPLLQRACSVAKFRHVVGALSSHAPLVKNILILVLFGFIAEEPNQKPHKDIFLKACKLTGSKPENSIMVGDNLKTDIQVHNCHLVHGS
jgi:HAD superfamily hydrolase (TIGR01549 family)